MRLPGSRCALLSLAALGLLSVAGPASAAEPVTCEVAVEPSTAPVGTTFVLTGSGYTPTQLVLQNGDGEPLTVDLDLGDQDPFSIPVGSGPGDEGRWTATVSIPDTPCSASVSFRVTLHDTAVGDELLSPTAQGGQVALVLYLLVMCGGFFGGVLLARRLGPA